MLRLLGFLLGSLTSILVILLILGVPTLKLDDREAAQQRYDAAIEMLRAKQQEIETVTGQLTEDVARVAETVGGVADDAVAIEMPPAVAAPVAEPPPVMDGTHWYSFWNPFRSEIAANGFVAQLERVTGIDYRVVKVRTGVYEVAFAYRDDDERRTKLSQIAAATGLDLPDS